MPATAAEIKVYK
jgi:hypothetical protein